MTTKEVSQVIILNNKLYYLDEDGKLIRVYRPGEKKNDNRNNSNNRITR